MKKILYVFVCLITTGCASTQPVTMSFPNSIPELMKKCDQLKTIQDNNVPITDLMETIVENYTLYYECANKVEAWQKWYTEQKKIYENTK